MLKHRIREKYGQKEVTISENEYLEQEAKIAMDFMVRWGCVAAVEDDEDSSGRQKIRMLTELELVERSFKAAKMFMQHARDNNLVHTCPYPEESEEAKE